MGLLLPPGRATGLSLSAREGLSGATPRGQPWTSAVTLPQRRNGLRARRMAVWYTFGGRISDLYFAYSEHEPKLIPIDEQPDDNVMHLDGLGKKDCHTGEAFNPGSQGQMFPLDLLRVTFARLVLIYLYMMRVSAPRVRIIFRDPKGLPQGFELQKYFVLATPKHVGQDLATAVI